MRLQSLFVIFSACLLAVTLQASPQERAGVAPEIAGMADRWAKLWSTKQLDAILALYEPDSVFLTGTGDRITGKAALREAFKKGMDSATARLTVHSVQTESSGDLAYDSGDYRETIIFTKASTRENRGSYVIVFRRQTDGKWLIAEHAWTQAPPAAK